MCCLSTGQFLYVEEWSPLQFMHFRRTPDWHALGGHDLPHLTHACLFLHCFFRWPIFWQFVHWICLLSMYILMFSI